jgi:hypothetical protein
MSIDAFVTSVEDASNTELSCPEKGGVVENCNFKGDAELFSCLTIDAVPTVAAKTEWNTIELSNTVIVGPIVTTVENVSNIELPGLEKVVIEVTMSDVTCNHNVIDRKGDNLCEVTVITSNVEVVNDKGGNIQSLLTRTFESRMALQSRARFRRRSIRCRLGNTSKSSVILITAKLFSLKSTALSQSCRVVNNPSIVFKDRSLESNKPMKGSSIQVSALKFTNTNKLNANKNIFILISLAQVVMKSNYLAIISFLLLYTAMLASLNKLPYYNETLIFL